MSDAPSNAPKKQRIGKGVPPDEFKFKKGKSGNPLGGKLHKPELRAIKRLTEDELVEIGSMIVKGSIEELQRVGKDKNCSAIKAMMAAVAVKAINKGDHMALDALLNRIVGKVKDRVEQSITLEPEISYKTKWGGTAEATDALKAPDDDE